MEELLKESFEDFDDLEGQEFEEELTDEDLIEPDPIEELDEEGLESPEELDEVEDIDEEL